MTSKIREKYLVNAWNARRRKWCKSSCCLAATRNIYNKVKSDPHGSDARLHEFEAYDYQLHGHKKTTGIVKMQYHFFIMSVQMHQNYRVLHPSIQICKRLWRFTCVVDTILIECLEKEVNSQLGDPLSNVGAFIHACKWRQNTTCWIVYTPNQQW